MHGNLRIISLDDCIVVLIWRTPGFEARLDCTWDGVDSQVDLRIAEQNNNAAAAFICLESGVNDVFVLTAPSIMGW